MNERKEAHDNQNCLFSLSFCLSPPTREKLFQPTNIMTKEKEKVKIQERNIDVVKGSRIKYLNRRIGIEKGNFP